MTQDSDNLYELIEAWLDNELSPDETAAFAKRLEGDENLHFRVEQHQLAREVIGHWVAEDYKTKIKSWQQDMEESPPPVSKSPTLKWWIIGVGLLLLVAGGIWCFTLLQTESKTTEPTEQAPSVQNSDQPVAEQDDNSSLEKESQEPTPPAPEKEKPAPKKKEEAIAKNKEQEAADYMLASAEGKFNDYNYAGMLNDRYNRRGSDDENFKEGKEAFSNKDYKKAIQLLSTVPSTSPDYTAALDYLAYSSYKIGDSVNAVDYYEQFAPRKIGSQTDWWLLQFYQADYNRSKAKFWKKLNEMIASPRNTVYKEKAVQLKKELEEKGLKE